MINTKEKRKEKEKNNATKRKITTKERAQK